ncbi:hypothetical protein [Bacillus sp. B-jedd]|uniref:hypothetical protein n=1 Tax=Bacillus sp. B-jedd TaxID=1476857 RepID=UPI0005155468|nr:hypothetical protein [Bacillus sp. B-jedd]CEG29589.1 hypothetical protein BN1002_04547 [Bacillus sp. B-jedd]
MGLLYETVIEAKRMTAIKELERLEVLTTETGRSIYTLSFEELMYEWRRAAFLAIDITKDANGMF